jgi:hypothetical protein
VRTRRVAIALVLASSSCVSEQKSDLAAARDAYEQCLEAHGGNERDCAALHERLRAAQDRYENDAQRAWGCVPERGDCPAHR